MNIMYPEGTVIGGSTFTSFSWMGETQRKIDEFERSNCSYAQVAWTKYEFSGPASACNSLRQSIKSLGRKGSIAASMKDGKVYLKKLIG